MNVSYQFQRVLGTVHTGADLQFSSPADPHTLVSATGHRLTLFDLRQNSTLCTFHGHNKDIDIFALQPISSIVSSRLAILASGDGHVTYLTFPRGVLLRRSSVFRGLNHVSFSPDGRLILFAGSTFEIHRVPSALSSSSTPTACLTSPYRVYRASSGLVGVGTSFGKVISASWIDSRFLVMGLLNSTVRVCKLNARGQVVTSVVLSGPRRGVEWVNFGIGRSGKRTASIVFCVDEEGTLVRWQFFRDGGWQVTFKKNLLQEEEENEGENEEEEKGMGLDSLSRVLSCDAALEKNLLVVGLASGTFVLYDLSPLIESNLGPRKVSSVRLGDINGAHLRPGVGSSPLDSVALSPSSSNNLIAVSSKESNELVVWDWRAETFVLRQRGHRGSVSALAYSPTGDVIASGDVDGKVKVWNCRTGLSFVTLVGGGSSESAVVGSAAKITGLEFSRPPGSRDVALFVGSADGTVRAFDLLRYRNFQTFVAPDETGFSTMSINPSGEIIAAAGEQTFAVYLWNVKTRQLLGTLSGHTGPVTNVQFAPHDDVLFSSSWDGSIRMWSILSSKTLPQEYVHSHEVITFAVCPTGNTVCASQSDGVLTFWDVETSDQVGFIECRRDILIHAPLAEPGTRVKDSSKAFFTSIQYTSDSLHVLCGSESQFVCMYSVLHRVLVRRFLLTDNLSLSGTHDLSEMYLGEYVKNRRLYQTFVHERRKGAGRAPGDQFIPGSQRELVRRVGASAVSFSPTNREFAVGSSEGVVVFTMDLNERDGIFRPLELSVDVTPEGVSRLLSNRQFSDALTMSLKLSEAKEIRRVFESVPVNAIEHVCFTLPVSLVVPFIEFLGSELEVTTHVEFCLMWVKSLLSSQAQRVMDAHRPSSITVRDPGVLSSTPAIASLRSVLRSLLSKVRSLAGVFDDNQFSLDYLSGFQFSGDRGRRDLRRELADERARKRRKVADDED